MELGALDGSPSTRSMTHEFEEALQWQRILIEVFFILFFHGGYFLFASCILIVSNIVAYFYFLQGDPRYRQTLRTRSPLAFDVNAAICEKHMQVSNITLVDLS